LSSTIKARSWLGSAGDTAHSFTPSRVLQDAVHCADQVCLAQVALLEYSSHAAVQCRPLFVRQVLGGNHQDRDVSCNRVSPHRSHDLESVHVGHHQVQQHDVGVALLC